MIVERPAHLVLALAVAGCMQHPQAPGTAAAKADDGAAARQAARAQVPESARRLELVLGQGQEVAAPDTLSSLRIVGMDEGPVPEFELLAPGGAQYSSKALVGQQPFVTVFFATWCEYCIGELKTLQRALSEVGPMVVIPVSADGP